MTDPLETRIDAWMQEFARFDERPRALPDPSMLWVRAKLMQSVVIADRAARPVTNAQIGSYLVVATAWAALLMWKWQALVTWVRGFTPAHIVLGATGVESAASLSLTFLGLLIVLGSLTVLLAFHTILAEE